ncbi:hypothetical protein SAMN06265348_112173 [Pedobacter westerhofensis]|uniref:Uncharacterized protein n=1 Tax=Pedobacter westerhofensis TaxID=425512 RepID=A0A521FJ88_9SPHI|nr:hypothetical protein [Pedobacter westerhofensis]SMO95660.1 hypothetical protein SAMN06265348_112173 [Pedobacter westerhofensis]
MTNTKQTYPDFKEFYTKAVEPLKAENVSYIRLDGKLKGDTRVIFTYFMYQDKKWKVNADTHIDRLKLAFAEFEKGNDPFVIKTVRDNAAEYLAIKGQPVRNAKLYIYAV